MSSKWNSFLTAIALGVLAISLTFAVGLPLNNVQQGAIAKANTAEVLQATATHVAELKERYLVISTTIQSAPEQIVNSDSVMIPLNEAPTEQVEALVPVTIYPTPPQPEQTPDDSFAVVVTLEMIPTATFAATLTIEPPPTPAPTDAPKATGLPTNTPQPEVTAIPLPTVEASATVEPTIEPSATATSVLVSPLATPTKEATAAP